jgi:hypothetical protein
LKKPVDPTAEPADLEKPTDVVIQPPKHSGTKIVSAIKVSELPAAPKRTPTEEAIEETYGRILTERRWQEIDSVFAAEIEKVFGKDFLKRNEGAIALIKADVKITLGNSNLADRDPLGRRNLLGYEHLLAKYEELKNELTIVNDTGEKIFLDGKWWEPDATIAKGEDNLFVQDLALDCIEILYHRACRSFTTEQTRQRVVFTPDMVDKKGGHWSGKKEDSLETKLRSGNQ